jgi:internalin A
MNNMKLNLIANSIPRYIPIFCLAMAMLLSSYYASAQSIETTNTSQSYTVIESMSLPDLTDDGFSDFGTLYLDNTNDKLRLQIIDGVSMEHSSVIIWNNIYDDPSLHVIADLNGNNVPEIGIFGIRNDNNNVGKPQLFVRDFSTGQNVRVFNWPANWSEVSALVLSDMTGDGIPEVAIQGRFKEGNRSQLVVRNGATNAIVSTYSYPDLLNSPEFFQHSDVDGDGVPEISTFGRIKRNDKIQVKIASGVDPKDRFKAYNFPDKWSDISWHRLDDMDGDGEDEWGLFGRNKEDGRPQLIVKRGTDPKGALAIYAWSADLQDAKFFLIPDMNNDGIDEVAVGGRRSNGRYQFQVKDGANRNSVLANHNLNLKLENISFHFLPDVTTDGIAEIGFLGVNNSGESELVVQEGDTVYGEYTRYTLGSDWSEAPSFISIGDTDEDGFPNILTYGQSSSTADIAFFPLSRVNLRPIANAGLAQNIAKPSTVTLSSLSRDRDGSISTYNWSQTSGETISLSDVSSSTTTFESPTIPSEDTLIFTLTVTDNEGATSVDKVMITIAPVTLVSDVTFSDDNLSNCVSDAATMNTWEFTYQVFELNCFDRNILTLDGIEHLTSLTDITLWRNQIVDIAALSNLTALTYLDLDENKITDISTLSNLTAITELYISENQISDISAVSNLTAITRLALDRNQIVDINALSSLTALTTLSLDDNQLTDISALSSLAVLADLFLNNNQISDINALSNITALTTLFLQSNQITDINAVSNLTVLNRLALDRNQIVDISALSNLTALTTLSLDDNQITDISAVSNLAVLDFLFLQSNQLVNISAISDLKALTNLYLFNNQISDISALSNLTALNTLFLQKNQIADVSALSNLTALTRLALDGNQIIDISTLSNLIALTKLTFDDNQITDISSLSNLTALTTLFLQSNQITNISPLSNLTALINLYLYNNQLSDISALSNLTALTTLLLQSNQIADISTLSNLTALTALSLDDNQIIDISALSNLTVLTTLSLNDNQIIDISALSNLTVLNGLALDDNQIVDISAVSNLMALDFLWLFGNNNISCTSLDDLLLVLNQNVDIRLPNSCI